MPQDWICLIWLYVESKRLIRESGLPDLLWADGELTIRVRTMKSGLDRLVRVRRPYAIVGRSSGADVRIDDPAVSGRHLYLHLDRRGVFAVDLLTRTGTRGEQGPIATTWLMLNEGLEVAGYRIELVDMRIDNLPLQPDRCLEDPIAEFTATDAADVTLVPRTPQESRWILNSELVFLGRSSGCGVRVDGGSAARIHGVIVRSVRGVYLVDLIGRLIWLNRRPIRGASPLQNGDILTIGSSEFTVQIATQRPTLPALLEKPAEPIELSVATTLLPRGHESMLMPGSFQASSSEAQQAFLAWLFGLFQAGQGEMLRRQEDFQAAMTGAIQEMREENTALLNEHLAKMEQIQAEIASLREIVQRMDEKNTTPALPKPAPIKIPARPVGPEDGNASAATTAWLLNRISSLEDESRSSWRDLFSRLGTSTRRAD